MSRACCIWKNNGLCNIGPHARMVGPLSFATSSAPEIVIQGLCKSLIKK
jgi:hypothetical protein